MLDEFYPCASEESDASVGDGGGVVDIGPQSVYREGAVPQHRKLFRSVSGGRGSDDERERTRMESDDA